MSFLCKAIYNYTFLFIVISTQKGSCRKKWLLNYLKYYLITGFTFLDFFRKCQKLCFYYSKGSKWFKWLYFLSLYYWLHCFYINSSAEQLNEKLMNISCNTLTPYCNCLGYLSYFFHHFTNMAAWHNSVSVDKHIQYPP